MQARWTLKLLGKAVPGVLFVVVVVVVVVDVVVVVVVVVTVTVTVTVTVAVTVTVTVTVVAFVLERKGSSLPALEGIHPNV